MRDLQEQLIYQRELEERRAAILTALSESGKLTEELERDICGADTKQRLEDLYLPYKPKRRTRAQIAREAGLEPLAKLLWEDPLRDPETEAEAFVNADKGVADVRAALDGARDILAEIFYENADMLEELREFLWKKAYLVSKVVPERRLIRQQPSTATILTTMNRSKPCRRTERLLCSAAVRKGF